MSGRILRTGVIGVLMAVLMITTVYFAATYWPEIRLPSQLPDKGNLVLKLTDAPVELEHLNITISNISAQRVDRDTETWENLPFVDGVKQVYVDILSLQNVTKDLSVSQISPGNYTKIRLTVTTANATFIDATTTELIVPPGQIDVHTRFEIKAGKTTTVLIDMEADRVAISQSARLNPQLKATVISS